MLQFDLDLGMRVDVEKKVAAWPKDLRREAWIAGSRWHFDDLLATFWEDSVMSRNIHNGSVLELTKVGRPKNDETDYWPGIVQIVHFVPWLWVMMELAALARLAWLAWLARSGWPEFCNCLFVRKDGFPTMIPRWVFSHQGQWKSETRSYHSTRGTPRGYRSGSGMVSSGCSPNLGLICLRICVIS